MRSKTSSERARKPGRALDTDARLCDRSLHRQRAPIAYPGAVLGRRVCAQTRKADAPERWSEGEGMLRTGSPKSDACSKAADWRPERSNSNPGPTPPSRRRSQATSTILYYAILYYTILHYIILYFTILYYTILYYTTLYDTILYHTTLHNTTLHYTTLNYTIQYVLCGIAKTLPGCCGCRAAFRGLPDHLAAVWEGLPGLANSVLLFALALALPLALALALDPPLALALVLTLALVFVLALVLGLGLALLWLSLLHLLPL